MCGKLAKRLRMLGFDVFYRHYIIDKDLLDICENEKRILLTKDNGFLKRKTDAIIYIVKGANPDEEIMEIISTFELKQAAKPFTMCITCGAQIKDIERECVINKVPQFVFKTQEKFKHCPACGKIYWQATHRKNMDKIIEMWFGIVVIKTNL